MISYKTIRKWKNLLGGILMGNQHKNKSFNIQDASKNNLLGEKLAKARKDQKIRQATLIKTLED